MPRLLSLLPMALRQRQQRPQAGLCRWVLPWWQWWWQCPDGVETHAHTHAEKLARRRISDHFFFCFRCVSFSFFCCFCFFFSSLAFCFCRRLDTSLYVKNAGTGRGSVTRLAQLVWEECENTQVDTPCTWRMLKQAESEVSTSCGWRTKNAGTGRVWWG